MSAVTSLPHGGLSSVDPMSASSMDRSTSFGSDAFATGASALPRSASYTFFPQAKDIYDESSLLELKGTISDDDLVSSHRSTTESHRSTTDGDSSGSSGGSSPDEETPAVLEMKHVPDDTRRTPRLRLTKFLLSGRESNKKPQDTKGSNDAAEPVQPIKERSKSRSPARAASKLRRKSWVAQAHQLASINGSPEASSEQGGADTVPGSGGAGGGVGSSPRRAATSEDVSGEGSPHKVRRTKRPLSTIIKDNTPRLSLDARSAIPKVPALPKSFSSDRLHALNGASAGTSAPPLPSRNPTTEKLKNAKVEVHKKKDELWSTFRSLDGDYHKFHSKSITLKANVVRTTLLPFLRSYAVHPSNNKIRPEDLDRRTNILNKWWTGLLEMVAGKNNQSISGTDRPTILDAISGIMERPEWRQPPSPFARLSDRQDFNSPAASISSASLSSNTSDFLAESVHHNVRNLFVQNLLVQMVFVVDKMSLRNAPASLVSFCGKTCAYAFFFCPGVAEVLVRLWQPSSVMIKRILDESGISRQTNLRTVAARIVPSFPTHLGSLGFASTAKTVRDLRKPAATPLGTVQVQWHGPWVKRWSGTESDLFYSFVKHYHILIADFLPQTVTHWERLTAPGLILVHAQILANLDATIRRHDVTITAAAAAAAPPQQMQDESAHAPAPITFDDVLSEPDATVSALPIPPTNARRLMAENRLLLLSREILSEKSKVCPRTRQIFAETISRLLKTAVQNISIYDHNTCYTLCDFLEEAMGILIRYEHAGHEEDSVLNWPFWMSVFFKMAESHNTTTEIRLYSLLFSTWGVLTADPARKADLCLNLLLKPEFFESRFNHWCPMVRAYYMRLLCWRVARSDPDTLSGDLEILQTLYDRLRSVWGHFLYLCQDTESRRALPPSTVACHPAPGRRLLIIRTDPVAHPSSSPLLDFSGLVPPASSTTSAGYEKQAMSSGISNMDVRSESAMSNSSEDTDEDTHTGKWNIFRNFLSTPRARSRSKSKSPARKSKNTGSEPSATDMATDGQDSSNSSPQAKRSSPPPPVPPLPQYQAYCFRFSLEWVDKRFHNPGNMRLYPPRLPLPAQIALHASSPPSPILTGMKPEGSAQSSSKYAGRALAEWTLVVNECQNFFERRRNEGVPSNRLVETPSLGVEPFRRPG